MTQISEKIFLSASTAVNGVEVVDTNFLPRIFADDADQEKMVPTGMKGIKGVVSNTSPSYCLNLLKSVAKNP